MKLRRLAQLVVALPVALGIAGCWDNKEMDEYGYVQGVAVDVAEDGTFALRTLFYNPSNSMSMGGDPKSAAQRGLTIETRGDTLFQAVREIPMKFGRKAKWDHMRVILLGENLLKRSSVGDILDFFSRDHEPRGTVLPIVAQSEAGKFIEIKPFIEETIGQQFKRMETEGAQYSAKTSGIPLFDLAIHLKSPARIAVMPYIHRDGSKHDAIVSGLAILRKGMLAGTLNETDTVAFMMLDNRYRAGILSIPCEGAAEPRIGSMESVEVLSFMNKTTVRISDSDQVDVDIRIRIKGTVGELQCTKLKTLKDTKRFEARIGAQVEEQLQHGVSALQQYKTDAIGIGNRIARRHPALWKRWESSWGERFAAARFRIRIETEVLGTGMDIGTPFSQEED